MLSGADFSKLTNIFCDTSNENCRRLLSDEEIGSKIKFYEKFGGQYFFDGKFYKSPNDIAEKNYDKKHIYRIEEAVAVTDPIKNTFKSDIGKKYSLFFTDLALCKNF